MVYVKDYPKIKLYIQINLIIAVVRQFLKDPKKVQSKYLNLPNSKILLKMKNLKKVWNLIQILSQLYKYKVIKNII